ncbi:hypothetical protein LIS77_22885 [Cytobacillus firmus]|uniref:hypothetical protein n=1 Tax=Cytobacillus firmus TaxID=1399 RepID=UPI00207A6ADC|nr:hypothetical protein [Cytobacillus firmus]USK38694.1 hypothetical protein LIS77_22885 [Cytobacillus firmus]
MTSKELINKLMITSKQLNKRTKKIEQNYIYYFIRNENGEIIYTEKDVRIIKAYKQRVDGNLSNRDFEKLAKKRMNRASDKSYVITAMKFDHNEDPTICSSCGVKIRNVYGTTRCGCN